MPETGLEPAHHMAYAPKAYVYTNFTTRAYASLRPALREQALRKKIISYLGKKINPASSPDLFLIKLCV